MEEDNGLRSDDWSPCAFAIAVRTYIFNEKFPDAHAIHKIPQFGQGETKREALLWLHRFVQSRVPEFRWEEVRDYLWFHLMDRPWEWDGHYAVEMDVYLGNVIASYLKRNPRKYRTIDEA